MSLHINVHPHNCQPRLKINSVTAARHFASSQKNSLLFWRTPPAAEVTAIINTPISLYIHLPWCLHKCGYCDFNSHATKQNQFPEQLYVERLITDLTNSATSLGHRLLQSIFVGGGTPSLFSPESIDKILSACHENFRSLPSCEVTLEANPGTFESLKFSEFLSAGVNRISIGAQSFNNQHLRHLERIHDSNEAISAIEMAHAIGFDNINVDLMFGLPDQSIENAREDVRTACQLPVTHISYYQLTIEPNTLFHRYPPTLPDEDTNTLIQTDGINMLAQHGFERYEVSAYARREKQCLHNLNYWQFGDYLGIGAGAHSKLTTHRGILRQRRTRQPASYIQAVKSHSQVVSEHLLDADTITFEFMLNTLRLQKGFSQSAYESTTLLDWSNVQPTVDALVKQAQLEVIEDTNLGIVYRASPHGYRFLNDILQQFLPE